MTRYASLSSSICDNIFGQGLSYTSLTSKASNMVKGAAIQGLESLKPKRTAAQGQNKERSTQRANNTNAEKYEKNKQNDPAVNTNNKSIPSEKTNKSNTAPKN